MFEERGQVRAAGGQYDSCWAVGTCAFPCSCTSVMSYISKAGPAVTCSLPAGAPPRQNDVSPTPTHPPCLALRLLNQTNTLPGSRVGSPALGAAACGLFTGTEPTGRSHAGGAQRVGLHADLFFEHSAISCDVRGTAGYTTGSSDSSGEPRSVWSRSPLEAAGSC